MFDKIFTVTYNSCNDCFCYLAPNALPNFKSGICLKASYSYGEKKTVFLSALANPSITKKDVVELSSLYAQTLNINEGETIVIETVDDLPLITSLTVMPITKNDYEIIETFADNIQSSLLDQISVINANENIIIWIGSNIYVTVYIEKVLPTSPGRIENLTEVSIEPPSNDTKSKRDSESQLSSNVNIDKKYIHSTKFDETDFRDVPLIYRMIPLKDQKFVRNLADHLLPFNVFVQKDYIEKHWSLTSTKDEAIICKVSLLSLNVLEPRKIYVKLCCLEDYIFGFDDCLPTQHIYVDDLIFKSLSSHACARISLERVTTNSYVKEIQISPVKRSQFNLEEFRLYLADNCTKTIVLNPNIPIEFYPKLKCSLKFDPSTSFCVVDENLVKNCNYSFTEECTETKDTEIRNSVLDYTMDYSDIPEIVDKVLYNCSGNRVDWFENVLLVGKPGAGKSCILQIIKEKLAQYPHYVHTETISCASLKGKTVDSLHKVLMATASELILHQPSCLILDDFEILCDNVTDENVNQNAVHFNRVSEMMQYYLNYIKTNKITVLASTKSTHRLNKLIYSTRGENLFKNLYNLKDLDKNDRTKLLIHFLNKFHIKGIDFNELARKTEGFVIQDLFNLIQKTVFEAYKEEFENEVIIKPDHFECALKTLNILSLQNVQLYSAGDKDFSHVGGLNDVKKLLLESLIWPTKYSSLFSNAPLRLQSGLLLYGPPGTGKTLLAGAAASHCGLRLISIKGPELLSKYIGASEQAVRDTFQKAQNARPCILFFDEFDSLAPRRGHDNTGVTDRVVNQLLTQLDGVESLTGVCVLAATSRPDLLDPALLRPGRLDRQVFCPLPDEESRCEILRILSKSMPLEETVDLNKIAQVTEGYSGADLQSILCTAQMSTIDLLVESKEMELQSISELHLETAIEKTRPSLSAAERAKYDRIYKKFQGGGMEDFKSGSRATMA